MAGEAARTGAMVVAHDGRGTLVASGPDRLTWLNGIVTCDVSAVAPGQGAFGLILNKLGKVISDLFVVASADRLFLSVAAGTHRALLEHFDRMLVMEDAEIADATDAHVWYGLHGPRASEVAGAAAVAAGGAAGSIDWTGLGGAALVVERARAADALRVAAERAPDVVVASAGAWARLRLERGVPEYGVDYGLDDNPHEAGLDQRAVSWTKGCYLGQEVVCMQGMRGKVKRRVVSLRIDGREVPPPGSAVSRASDGVVVGEVTSACDSDRLAAVVALARVQGSALEVGDPLQVGASAAHVVDRPEP